MKKRTAKAIKQPAKTAKPVAKKIPSKPAPRKATAAKEPANRDLAAAIADLAAIAAELRRW